MGGFFVPTIPFYLQELRFDRAECGLHTLIHTFAFEAHLQYLGSSLENAESLAPLSFSQDLVLRFLVAKV